MVVSISSDDEMYSGIGFAADFQEYLNASEISVKEWLGRQVDASERFALRRKAICCSSKNELDTISSELLALKFQERLSLKGDSNCCDDDHQILVDGGLTRSRLQPLMQMESLNDSKSCVVSRISGKKQKIQALLSEQSYHFDRAEEAEKLKLKVEASKETTIQDLTRGILNYKYVGLDFEKAAGGRLRLSFTQIDPVRPNHKFSFEIGLSGEKWFIENIQPIDLPRPTVQNCEQNFNDSDDMSHLVYTMRQAFLHQIWADSEQKYTSF